MTDHLSSVICYLPSVIKCTFIALLRVSRRWAETERQHCRASVPWGLLGMLALVAIAEAALSHDDRYYTRLDNMNYRFPGAVCREVAHREVLCFGDSLVKMGVVPKVIEERLGKSTYNLSVAGGMPSATYILLRRVVEQGGRPSAVLVDFKPSNLAVNPRVLVRPLAELTTTRESVELNWHYGDDTFLAITVLSKLFTSYRDREDIRQGPGSAGVPSRASREPRCSPTTRRSGGALGPEQRGTRSCRSSRKRWCRTRC